MKDRSGKWVEFKLVVAPNPQRKTGVWAVVTKGGSEKEVGGITLGKITWYPAWRKYVFAPEDVTIYEPTCLRDIASFIDDLMAERKTTRGPASGRERARA